MTLKQFSLDQQAFELKIKNLESKMLRNKKERKNDQNVLGTQKLTNCSQDIGRPTRGSKGGVWVVHYATSKLSHRTSSPSTLNPAKSGITTIKSEFPHYTQRRGSVGQ